MVDVGREILRPVRWWWMSFTLLAGLALNALPVARQPLNWSPDWFVLALLFWGLNQPRQVGFTWAFAGGLVMDVMLGDHLGQYALTHVLMLYAMLHWRQRLTMLTPWQQAVHVFLVLLGGQTLLALIRWLSVDEWPHAGFWLAPFTAALCWWPLGLLLRLPQRKPRVTGV